MIFPIAESVRKHEETTFLMWTIISPKEKQDNIYI